MCLFDASTKWAIFRARTPHTHTRYDAKTYNVKCLSNGDYRSERKRSENVKTGSIDDMVNVIKFHLDLLNFIKHNRPFNSLYFTCEYFITFYTHYLLLWPFHRLHLGERWLKKWACIEPFLFHIECVHSSKCPIAIATAQTNKQKNKTNSKWCYGMEQYKRDECVCVCVWEGGK